MTTKNDIFFNKKTHSKTVLASRPSQNVTNSTTVLDKQPSQNITHSKTVILTNPSQNVTHSKMVLDKRSSLNVLHSKTVLLTNPSQNVLHSKMILPKNPSQNIQTFYDDCYKLSLQSPILSLTSDMTTVNNRRCMSKITDVERRFCSSGSWRIENEKILQEQKVKVTHFIKI